MTTTQAILFGVMLAYTPAMLLLALALILYPRDVVDDERDRSDAP